jgi:thrombospondin type 3 repeat protein/IPT/TIG domain-containing protein
MSPRCVRSLLVAALCLLVLPAGASAAVYPSIKKVAPAKLGVGDTITITGKNFRKGKNKNTVVFRRDGSRAIFVKAPSATTTRIRVVVPAKLLPFLTKKRGKPTYTRFRIRILARRFGKRFTSAKASPLIGPRAIGGAGATVTAADCDGDGVPNSRDGDDDNDLISDTTEASIKTDPCRRDSDGDGMSDGWEYYSALDRNSKVLPYPGARPYPNALDATDGGLDQDGDGLTNADEYAAWATYGANRLPLSYSGGNPTSAGRAPVPAELAYMDRDGSGYLSDNERDADGDRISNQDEGVQKLPPLLNVVGFFSDAYLKLPEIEAVRKFVPLYDRLSYVEKVDPLDWLSSDTDGDGVHDDVDDQDHDDVPNLAEFLAELNSPIKLHRHVDACVPNIDSRFCIKGAQDPDHDGILNRDDSDDDNDGLSDALESQIGTRPDKADTDGDGVSDGFEYESAIDLNNRAMPFPGKRPYPNPLDGSDANLDFDQDSLTLTEEYLAWRFSGSPATLSYSDGTKYTGGKVAVPAGALDLDGNGYWSDDEKDVDADGLTNFDETHGAMRQGWWLATYGPGSSYKESKYPGPDYLEPSFVDPDSDGDGKLDGADDQDHDGLSNAAEVRRPANWAVTYISTGHAGTNKWARVQPFNPCKPVNSDACHSHPPTSYYPATEDWESQYDQSGALRPGYAP